MERHKLVKIAARYDDNTIIDLIDGNRTTYISETELKDKKRRNVADQVKKHEVACVLTVTHDYEAFEAFSEVDLHELGQSHVFGVRNGFIFAVVLVLFADLEDKWRHNSTYNELGH